MRRSTFWVVAVTYFTSLVLGLVGFCVNRKTGEFYTTSLMTVYSGLMGASMFSVLPILLRMDFNPTTSKGHDLHIRISGVIYLTRIAVILISVVINWAKRHKYVSILGEFQEFHRSFCKRWSCNEKLEEKMENDIKWKFYLGFVTNLGLFVVSWDFLDIYFKLRNSFDICLVDVLCVILNLIMFHYYCCMVNINYLLGSIYEEVKRILELAHNLWSLEMRGHLAAEACESLARYLDELMRAQFQVQSLGKRINNMYQLQGGCCLANTYMHTVTVIYMAYMVLQHEYILQIYSRWAVIIIWCTLIFFHMDLKIFFQSMFDFVDFQQKFQELLRDRQTHLPLKSELLEESVSDNKILNKSSKIANKISK